jgi:signal transduction histidine kinase
MVPVRVHLDTPSSWGPRGTAERPAAGAKALLAEAREASAKALAELRALVRGIHPPVLADRGLADAVRALALDSGLNVDVVAGLSGRPQAPVESAAYFAVSELLANVFKHACARRTWIDLRYEAGVLRVDVADDGQGGADPSRGPACTASSAGSRPSTGYWP